MTQNPGYPRGDETEDAPDRSAGPSRRFGDDDRQRTRDQIALIRQSIDVTVDTSDDADFTFMCNPEHILVRDPMFERADARLDHDVERARDSEPRMVTEEDGDPRQRTVTDGYEEPDSGGDDRGDSVDIDIDIDIDIDVDIDIGGDNGGDDGGSDDGGDGSDNDGDDGDGSGDIDIVRAVRNAVSRRQDVFEGELREESRPVDGVVRYRLPNRRGTDAPDVIDAVNVIEQELYEALGPVTAENAVSPDHIVHVCGAASSCPATEPEETGLAAPWPPVNARSDAGTGVRIAVLDTGLDVATRDATPWLAGVTGDAESGGSPGALREYEGHGTFIAGVVRCAAPAATVEVHQFLKPGGVIDESDLAGRIQRMLDESDPPDIISISAGTRSRRGQPLISLEQLWRTRLKHLPNTVIVAAAGNDGSNRPFWPASFRWAVGVGSLDRDGDVSDFSNHGSSANSDRTGSMNVFALGRNHINAFPNGTLTCKETPHTGDIREFHTGLARWSGTSFSAPLVAGMIAARMSCDGVDAKQAAEAVRGDARRFYHPQLFSWIRVISPQ
ncbi:MAG: S8 family peptidase [Dermatophilaceae bacterium]